MKKLIIMSVLITSTASAQFSTRMGLYNRNIFGALIAGQALTNSEKAAVLNNLHAKYGRLPIFITTFSGSSGLYNAYTAAGIKVALNINNAPIVDSTPNPYPSDLSAYAAGIQNILNKYQPALVVIENEEQNDNYFTGTPEEYISMLEVAIPVVHSYGLKVADGGLLYAPVASLIYWELLDSGQTTEAATFLANNVPPSYHGRFTNPGANPAWVTYVAEFQTLIDYFATSDLDYVNFHVSEPANTTTADDTVTQATTAITYAANFLRRKTGKKIITNEIGQRNLNPTLTENIMQLCLQNNLKFAIWYSGDEEVQQHYKALTEIDGTLRTTGEKFASLAQ